MNFFIKAKFAREKKDFLIEKMLKGNLFFYPTDTVYGLGCDATNEEALNKINKIKGRNKPLSVIVPSKDWIRENCEVSEEYLNLLPGEYTLIVKVKKGVVSEIVSDNELLGVRIPKHWFSEVVNKADIPFVTTSANISGETPCRNVKDAKKLIKNVDVVIDEGTLSSKPSTIINTLSGEKIR